MRLDEADQNAPVRLRIRPVHHQRTATILRRTHNRHTLFLISVMVEYAQPPAHLRAHDPLKLLRRIGAVRSRADDNNDIPLRHMRQLRQNPRQQPCRGQRPRAVGDDDRNALMRADRLRQGARAVGPPHRLPERSLLVRQPLHKARADDRRIFGGQFSRQSVLTILEMDLHCQHPFYTTVISGRTAVDSE